MSRSKGVSAEEKRMRMLQLFHEKKEFFQLKDLEKIAPKEKGIIANSVKDVLQSLVDDGSVDTDKIGTSVYFWAFQSKAMTTKRRKLEELSEQCDQTTKQLKIVTEAVNQLKGGREETQERNVILDEITELQIERDELNKELAKYEDNDPAVLKSLKKETEDIKNSANRWTDNIFSVKSWCKKKFSVEDQTLDKQFGIPADFDYVE